MSIENISGKDRIQDPEEAHEKANMLASYFEDSEKPTAEDYDEALRQLEILEKAVNEESVPDAADKALRTFFAGAGVVVNKVPRLLVAAALHVLPYPKSLKDRTREVLGGGVIEQLKNTKGEYKDARVLLRTAREELEQWKAEAEGLAKKQLGQKP